ncbi:hypothetical protein ACUXV3_06515 [Roseobacteraceae bacterium NS-SX3]
MKLATCAGLAAAAIMLSACDVGPNGYGTAPAGISQAEWDRQQRAEREARRAYYRGPRGGHSGR